MATQNQLSRAAAKELLSRSPDQLYELLGVRAKATEDDLSKQGFLDPAVAYSEHMGPKEDLEKIGRRMFHKLQTQAYGLVCGKDPEDESDRNKIVTALGIGTEAAVIALTSVLIGTFGLAAALAGVLAALIIKRFAEPTLKEGQAAMCELWKENLTVNK